MLVKKILLKIAHCLKNANKSKLNFSLYIAKRYLVSNSSNTAINIINRIASVGVIVGAMALFVVLSVFSGLKEFSLSFANKTDPDLKISSTLGKSFFVNNNQIKELQSIEGIDEISKIVEEKVLFTYNDKQLVTTLKGVDVNFTKVNPYKETLYTGQWLAYNTAQVVVGYGIAQQLSMGLFDYNNFLQVMVPKPGKGNIETPEQAFNQATLYPIGIYAINDELDNKYIFADLQFVQDLMQYKPNQVSTIEVKLAPKANATQITNQINSFFKNTVTVKNRAQLNDALYKMLNTENVAVYLIFTLVIVIALFNLIGALIMMIIDKKQNLITLQKIGANLYSLRNIFLLQGFLLSLFSAIIGLLLGVVITLLQQHFQLIMITPTLAYPVVCSIQNAVIVLLTIIVLGFLASLIASSRITAKLLK